jgi:hypothetical protein
LVDTFVKQWVEEGKTAADRAEITRVFRQRVADDLAYLKDELGEPTTDFLTSKEVVAGAIAGAGALATGGLGPAVAAFFKGAGFGALFNSGRKLAHDRRAILARHATSWLVQATKESGVLIEPRDAIP